MPHFNSEHTLKRDKKNEGINVSHIGMTFNSSYKAKECYTDYGRIKLVLMSC